VKRGLAAAGCALAVAWAAIFLVGPWADERVTDLFIYHSVAQALLHGSLPYRDFAFEYPPLAAPVLALPGLAGGGAEGYRLAFGGAILAAAALLVALCGRLAERTGGDPRRAMVVAAAAPLLCGAMIRTHFDLVAVTVTMGALAALAGGRVRTAFALLGIGAATKAFPLVVAPVALSWLLARRRRREALRGAAALALVIGAVAVTALALSPDGAADSVRYHLERPVQVESTPALALLALDGAGIGDARSVHSHRSDGLEHPASGVVTALEGLLLAAVVAALCAAAARREDDGAADARRLVLASLAAVVACIAFAKVLSPQFLLWLVPLGALALAWGELLLAAAAASALVLTLAEFPSRYADVVAREPLALGLVTLRDAALLATLGLAARALTRPAGVPARSPLPGRPARPRWPPRSATGPRRRSRTWWAPWSGSAAGPARDARR
jgi:glycosyl transferase family 87